MSLGFELGHIDFPEFILLVSGNLVRDRLHDRLPDIEKLPMDLESIFRDHYHGE
jgi:hypothetical protein